MTVNDRKEALDILYRNNHYKPIQEQIKALETIIEETVGAKIDLGFEAKTELDTLEILQETYSFIYCLVNEIEYATFEAKDHLHDNYLNWIAEYKMLHFSDEILGALGIEIIEKREDGFLVKDKKLKN